MPERQTPPGKYRRRRRRRRNNGPLIIAVLAVILIVLIGVAIWASGLDSQPEETTGSTDSTAGTSSSTTQSTAPSSSTEPTEPPVTKVSTATISNTGDFLMHMGVTNSGYNAADQSYSYESIFTYFADYVKRADYAVANFETTTYGPDWTWYYNGEYGKGYSGFPWFNSPDGIVTSLKDAGFDLMLAANNHIYDTRETGFYRTQQIFQENGLDWLGIIPDQEQTLWKVKEINGIKVGMVCYTYADHREGGKISLNGNSPMSEATTPLISTFSYDYLGDFYEEMETNIAAMEAAGAEAVVLYIHWGYEYQVVENPQQNKIAQKMCDLGVDVIVGGHPHVVQPMELLTSTVDPEQKTVCLYSTGNAVSNQRLGNLGSLCKTAHTEDGVLFTFTFAKYSDGTVILESAEILPLWVNLYNSSSTGKKVYEILPLDKQVTDWKTQFQLTDSVFSQAEASYERTMKIVGGGLEEVQQYLQTQVAETEARLGIV